MNVSRDAIADRFRLERVIGTGGMGTVFRALDLETDTPVALKLITEKGPEELERFARESRVLAELRHPHVVHWVAHGLTRQGDPFLAMEWLDGEDLGQRLARRPLSALESVQLAVHTADALAAAHALGITHRDIKPGNIFLPHGSVEELRVLDFGIARSSRDAGLTRTGAVVGTVGFMAPEQLRGERTVGPRTDIFALGCVLFECLTRERPFTGPHPMAMIIKILLEDAPRVRELAPAIAQPLDDLVARMLERDIARRVASCTELLAELRALEAGTLASEPPVVRASLTSAEQRVVSLIVAATELTHPQVATTMIAPMADVLQSPAPPPAQMTGAMSAVGHAGLHAAVEPFGATLEMPNGSHVVALLAGEGTTAEQAARAASCALAMRALLPDVPMALVTGLCVVNDRLPVGPLIDRAVVDLETAPRHGVRVDELTGRLIADRFEVLPGEHGLVLFGKRDVSGSVRRLLGQPTPCVGRERDIATLQAVFDECVSDEVSRTALVTGPPGLGKTRLVHEFLRSLGQRGADVAILEGRGDAVSPGVAFGILGRAIRGAAGIVDGEALEAKRERLAELVLRHLPAAEHGSVLPFLGELAGVPFEDADDVSLRAAASDPSLMTSKLEHAFLRWLEAECDSRPVLLVLEDLQWADALSVRYVERALDRLAERPFMVLATGRPEVFDLFPTLRKNRARSEIVLAGLSKRAAQRLVHAVLGEAMAQELVARLVERADGNPFFLEELLRHAAEGRADTLPTSMIGIVHMRLDGLEAETRRLLRAASIIGETFWAGSVAHLTAERPAAVAARIDELVGKELLTRRPKASLPDDEQLAFRHALVREVAYATLTEEDRRLGHRLAAEWLEGSAAVEPATVAGHCVLGGESARAAVWFERAAVAALEVNDLDGALGWAARGLACDPEPRVESALRLVTGRTLRWKNELEQATTELERAFAALPCGSKSWFVAGADLVNVVARRGLIDIALAVTEEMLTTPCAHPEDRAARAIALARAAHKVSFPRLFPLGEAAVRGAQEQARELTAEEPLLTAQLRSAEWAYLSATGSFGAALRASREAASTFESIGDRPTLFVERGTVLWSMCDLGLFQGVLALAPSWIAEATGLGVLFPAAMMRVALGRAARALGDPARAKSELGLAAEWLGERAQASWPLAQLSLLALAEDALDEAERHAAHGMKLGRRFIAGLAPNLACLARLELARGAAREAKSLAAEALDVIESTLGVMPYDALVRRAFVDVHDAAGDRAAADRQLAAASAAFRQRATRIDDPVWRAAFLAVPDQRALLDLAAERGL